MVCAILSQKVQKVRFLEKGQKVQKVPVRFLIKKSEYIKTFKQKRLTVHRGVILVLFSNKNM
jgi:hypothetical protein